MTAAAAEKLFDAIADTAAAVDEIVEEMHGQYQNRVVELLDNPTQRDEILWLDAWEDSELEALGVLPDVFLALPLAALFDEPLNERGMEWQRIVATMIAAAKLQASLPVIRRVLGTTEDATRQVQGAAQQMSPQELKQAAAIGPGRARFDGARERRRAERAAAEGSA